jgi:N-acetyl-gamma-glutamyl-phosphate reductase
MRHEEIGIVGVSGFGGGELLRLCAGHPAFEIAYVAGSPRGEGAVAALSGAGGHPAGRLVVQPFVPEETGGLDVLFVSLPTGKSREPLRAFPRPRGSWTSAATIASSRAGRTGLTELPGQRERLRSATRVANPGCYPAAALLALAPLAKEGLIETAGLIVDAASGVTGTGRGGASDFGYVDTSEDFFAYGLESHPHVPELEKALAQVASREATVAFTPHLVPMKRGLLATCHARPRGAVTAARLYEAAAASYESEPFIRVVPAEKGRSPHTRWANGSNLAFVSYAVNPRTGHVIALCAIDNLGKGAAGQALQNANLITGQAETAGLTGLAVTGVIARPARLWKTAQSSRGAFAMLGSSAHPLTNVNTQTLGLALFATLLAACSQEAPQPVASRPQAPAPQAAPVARPTPPSNEMMPAPKPVAVTAEPVAAKAPPPRRKVEPVPVQQPELRRQAEPARPPAPVAADGRSREQLALVPPAGFVEPARVEAPVKPAAATSSGPVRVMNRIEPDFPEPPSRRGSIAAS